MIGSNNNDHITWQLIELHQKKRHNSFNFARFVRVAAFFSNCVKLIEKKNARLSSHIVEEFSKARVCLAEITSDESVIANHEESKA